MLPNRYLGRNVAMHGKLALIHTIRCYRSPCDIASQHTTPFWRWRNNLTAGSSPRRETARRSAKADTITHRSIRLRLIVTAEASHRALAAIMFTDMVGYSALAQRDDELALELLEEHRRLLREIFPRFHGIEIKTIGDGFLVEFHSALEAAAMCNRNSARLSKRNADAPVERRIAIKIGVHIGDVVHRDHDVYGDGVNIASRIEPLAGPGGICVSVDVERQIRNKLEAHFEKLAPTELKNISMPMDLFRIIPPWEEEGFDCYST